MQGSFTLQQWNAQSVPSLSSILEEQPQGVIKKCDSTAPIAGLPQTFRLDEIEEDEPLSHPGKMFQMSTHITTITNSRVMHPDDGTSVTPRYNKIYLFVFVAVFNVIYFIISVFDVVPCLQQLIVVLIVGYLPEKRRLCYQEGILLLLFPLIVA